MNWRNHQHTFENQDRKKQCGFNRIRDGKRFSEVPKKETKCPLHGCYAAFDSRDSHSRKCVLPKFFESILRRSSIPRHSTFNFSKMLILLCSYMFQNDIKIPLNVWFFVITVILWVRKRNEAQKHRLVLKNQEEEFCGSVTDVKKNSSGPNRNQ